MSILINKKIQSIKINISYYFILFKQLMNVFFDIKRANMLFQYRIILRE